MHFFMGHLQKVFENSKQEGEFKGQLVFKGNNFKVKLGFPEWGKVQTEEKFFQRSRGMDIFWILAIPAICNYT